MPLRFRDCRAILFDLDGTVLDTAPDLLAAVNVVRAGRGLPPRILDGFRSQVSRGARAMLAAGLPGFAQAGPERQMADVHEFLAAYHGRVCHYSRLFDGMAQVLERCAARGLAMAIVTNKPEAMAVDLLAAMDLGRYFPVLLGGDSLAERKPHPLPVLTACQRLGVVPAQACMVGDDERDIGAGRAAGCTTVAVTWGYADPALLPDWRADVVIDRPGRLLELLAP